MTTLNPYFDDRTLTYHDSNNIYTPDELLYYWKRVLEKTSYQVKDLCCDGTGIIFQSVSANKNISTTRKKQFLEFLESK